MHVLVLLQNLLFYEDNYSYEVPRQNGNLSTRRISAKRVEIESEIILDGSGAGDWSPKSEFSRESGAQSEDIPPRIKVGVVLSGKDTLVPVSEIIEYLSRRANILPSLRLLHFAEHYHGSFLAPWHKQARKDILKLVEWLDADLI